MFSAEVQENQRERDSSRLMIQFRGVQRSAVWLHAPHLVRRTERDSGRRPGLTAAERHKAGTQRRAPPSLLRGRLDPVEAGIDGRADEPAVGIRPERMGRRGAASSTRPS